MLLMISKHNGVGIFELLGSVLASEIVVEVKYSLSTQSPPFLSQEQDVEVQEQKVEVQGFGISLVAILGFGFLVIMIFGFRVGSNTAKGFGLAQP